MTLNRFLLIAVLFGYKSAVVGTKFGNLAFRDTSGLTDTDLREIQRQNQITKQILQNFLERSIYGKRFSSAPSLLDILPNNVVRRPANNNIQDLLGNSTQESDKETLDGDETENFDSYYEDFDFEVIGTTKTKRKLNCNKED